jgi:hypothetical protein
MNGERELFEKIKELIGARRDRVRLHAVRHMIEEGFSEQDMLGAIASGKSRILENYPDESRCLIFGHFMLDEKRVLRCTSYAIILKWV